MPKIMNLLHLAPDLQEQILFLPAVSQGRDPIHLRRLQSITRIGPGIDACGPRCCATARLKRTIRARNSGIALKDLDGAARVLAETRKPMSCLELIAAMAANDYSRGPSGKTPDATHYAAMTTGCF
jgi:hypothetical protein